MAQNKAAAVDTSDEDMEFDDNGLPIVRNNQPQYITTENCYLAGDIYVGKDDVDENGNRRRFVFLGHPEHYMVPVNKAARDMVAKYPPKKFVDPIDALTMSTGDVTTQSTPEVEAVVARALSKILSGAAAAKA